MESDTSVVYTVKNERGYFYCRHAFEARFSYIEKSFLYFCGEYFEDYIHSLMCKIYYMELGKEINTNIFEIRHCKVPTNMEEIDNISASGRIVLLHIKDTHDFLTKINGHLFSLYTRTSKCKDSAIHYNPDYDMFYLSTGEDKISKDYPKYCVLYNINKLSDTFFEDNMFDAAYEVSYHSV